MIRQFKFVHWKLWIWMRIERDKAQSNALVVCCSHLSTLQLDKDSWSRLTAKRPKRMAKDTYILMRRNPLLFICWSDFITSIHFKCRSRHSLYAYLQMFRRGRTTYFRIQLSFNVFPFHQSFDSVRSLRTFFLTSHFQFPHTRDNVNFIELFINKFKRDKNILCQEDRRPHTNHSHNMLRM